MSPQEFPANRLFVPDQKDSRTPLLPLVPPPRTGVCCVLRSAAPRSDVVPSGTMSDPWFFKWIFHTVPSNCVQVKDKQSVNPEILLLHHVPLCYVHWPENK